MHIPDGFLDPSTCAATTALSAWGLSSGLRRLRTELTRREVPYLAVMGALIFVCQMINFPIPGGTSGHLLGSALATLLLGPWAASVVMSIVLLFQCLLFQDGGLTALGANVFNMAVVGVWCAWFARKLLVRGGASRTGPWVAFAAGWISIVASAAMASVELAWSGTIPLRVGLPAMVFWHSLIGVGEGLITMTTLPVLQRQLAGSAVLSGGTR